ncbi:YHS domain-containing (seleno)protein [Roseofilum casamattae]|uniref:YHS domain-containing (Seleno)protein n=1 Tax=Roseofilum casamattae BLCC-M143 TaxID=3022442 RepID=A0ABT7C0M4_9CYAN|nr:YHS domain-containing (seleno)protein [Roseofilum casamattae]MDJ1184294.1 YHS domain-containing (seleno)protein [Roseofilum casamattae BLCC-M143]
MLKKILVILALNASLVALVSCGSSSESTSSDRSSTATEVESDRQLDFSLNLDERGRALRGYDPVAYFSEGKPVEGNAEFTLDWNEATWYFANADNRDRFAANPEKFAPANGGYCTFGIVLAKKFDGDPNVWSLYENKLYVFLNEEVKDKFFKDPTGNLKKVTDTWPSIASKSPAEL